jgi:hypothetical protein
MRIDNPEIKNTDGNDIDFGGSLGEVRMYALSVTSAVTKSNLQSQGWAICDGTTPATQGISDATITSTPDLREKFLRHSANETTGGTGGTSTHNHQWHKSGSSSGGYPLETLSGGTAGYSYDSDGNQEVIDDSESGNIKGYNYYTDNQDTKPPYYDVVYFIKVK